MWYSTVGCMVMLTLSLLMTPLAAHAQPPAKVPRVGVLAERSPTDPFITAFRQGLRELGYTEGQSMVIEERYAYGVVDRFPALIAELLDLNIDALVVAGTNAAQAAKARTSTVPIVFTVPGDPVGAGLVASLARPGGNVTGLSLLAPEITARQLQLLKEAVPKASRVAVLSNPANSFTALLVKETEAAARSLGLRVHVLGVRGADALEGAFSTIAKERPDAFFTLADPMLFVHRMRIAEFANKNRLPATYPHREYAEAGGLMAYGADLRDNFRRAATFVDKILKGAKPADLPVEQPTKFELIINLRTAKALGLTIPPAVLARADEVIE
jgi:putative tryptophan/tyrosine transport system substrate-binding protein